MLHWWMRSLYTFCHSRFLSKPIIQFCTCISFSEGTHSPWISLPYKSKRKSHETDVLNILYFISYSIFPYTHYSRCEAFVCLFEDFFLSITIHNCTDKATKLFFYVNVWLKNVIYMVMMQSMTSKFLVFAKAEILPSNPPLFYYRNVIQVTARNTGI